MKGQNNKYTTLKQLCGQCFTNLQIKSVDLIKSNSEQIIDLILKYLFKLNPIWW